MNASIKSIEIQANATRCEVVTMVKHEAESAKCEDGTETTHSERRFPVRAMAPYATARDMARVAQLECPTALVSLRFC